MKRVLAVFTRWPEPGSAKSRLAPALGAAGAAELARAMTEHTLRRIAGVCAAVEIRFTGGDLERLRSWLGAGLRYLPQGEGDLGRRMRRAFEEGFSGGAEAVAVVGTDCPDLDAAVVDEAFLELRIAEAVFGPAEDGGYYLLALSSDAWARAERALFTGIPWGGGGVLAASLAAAEGAGLSVRLLRPLADVDRPEDLPLWGRARSEPCLLSVVVPTLEEQIRIGPLIDQVRREPAVEIIVADGGSRDGTREVAAEHGARVVRGERGRALQMNAGAAEARGSILLFLHADTRLPAGFGRLVREALAEPTVVGGAFTFATDSDRLALRVVERAARWRGRYLHVVFGDQAIFARRQDFDGAGGFPVQTIMEDCEFLRRLRRRGKVALLPERAVTSARRWEEHGVLRTSVANVVTTAAWAAGLRPAALSRLHRGFLGRGRPIV